MDFVDLGALATPHLVAVLFARTLTTLPANATAMMSLLPMEAGFFFKVP